MGGINEHVTKELLINMNKNLDNAFKYRSVKEVFNNIESAARLDI